MGDTMTAIYCLCDEFLEATGHRDDPQVRLSTSEVMTVPLVAATFFGANLDKTRCVLHEYGYMPNMISKGRFDHHLCAVEPGLWRELFALLAEAFKRDDPDGTYVVDSLAVAVCDNIRIRRCRMYPPKEHGRAFRRYIASKRRSLYGLRMHLVVTGAGEPVEFALAVGSEADVAVFKDLDLDMPEGSIILADKAYTDYEYEDLLEEVGLHLKAQRKKNSASRCRTWTASGLWSGCATRARRHGPSSSPPTTPTSAFWGFAGRGTRVPAQGSIAGGDLLRRARRELGRLAARAGRGGEAARPRRQL